MTCDHLDLRLARKVHFFLLVNNVNLRDQSNGFQPDGIAPTEFKEGVVCRVGVYEDSDEEYWRIDVEIVVEFVSVLVIALFLGSIVPSSRVFWRLSGK